jgi:DNA replication protein DnaC
MPPEDIIRQRWEVIEKAVGGRYRHCTLDNFKVSDPKQESVLNDLRDYGENVAENVAAGVGVVLFGPPGTGKDHLAVGLLRIGVEAGLTARWCDGMHLFGKLRDSIGRKESEGSILRPLCECDVLTISDPIPPWGPLTEFQAAFLFRLIDNRYRARRPIWITANFGGREEAETRIGSQVLDRLKDGSIVKHCNWPSYRRSLP